MRLSIVTPCYNESANIDELHRRLSAVADRLPGEVEFVFVNDGSKDATLEKLTAVSQRDGRAVVLNLSRNFGHQAALTAGIEHASGDAVVVLDADLQHPPELISQFVEKWQEGYDLVYAFREGVKPRWGYRLVNSLMKIRIPEEAADFRLMDRRVVEAFRAMPERARFIRGMLSWLGFRQLGIGYRQDERFAGERTYTIRQTLQMVLNAVLSFSSIPLRLASVLGMVTLLAGLLYAVYILIAKARGAPYEEHGWASLIMTVLIMGGVQLLSLGIMAEYIGRIFEEVKRRPLYVVRDRLGGSGLSERMPSVAGRGEVRNTPSSIGATNDSTL